VNTFAIHPLAKTSVLGWSIPRIMVQLTSQADGQSVLHRDPANMLSNTTDAGQVSDIAWPIGQVTSMVAGVIPHQKKFFIPITTVTVVCC
jgi:hypothetical protein